MNNVIYYFSGTGNSLNVSKDLANELKNTRVISIKKAIQENIEEPIEKVGFVFPVYFGALPPIVADFIENLDNIGKYVYAIVTHNDFPGAALNIVAKILKKKGGTLNAGFKIRMPGSYIVLYDALSNDKQMERFKEANQKIKDIAKAIKDKKSTSLPWFGSVLTFLQKRNNKKLATKDKNFWVNEKCTSCRICEKICPVQNIEFINEKPQWQHNCQQCLACLQWCPEEAIEYGKNTINRTRYQNPHITIKDLLE